MKYGIIGAGAMGYRFGVMMQENAGINVDFIDTWEPNVEKVRQQGGVTVSRDHEDRHIVPINIYYPEEYNGHPDVWIIFKKQMQLADELQLPIVPVTIDGSFEILPRTAGFSFVRRHKLIMTIHAPIPPCGKGMEDIKVMMEKSYEAIESALPEKYKKKNEA